MPGLDPGIHDFLSRELKDVDGRDKPGHDELRKGQRYFSTTTSLICMTGAASV